MAKNWLISQEFIWRNAAAAVWTWVVNSSWLLVALFVWTFTPSNHIYAVYDYFLLLFSFRVWVLIFCISCLSSLFVKLHMQGSKVTCKLPTTRFQSLVAMFSFKRIFLTMCHGVLCGVITAFLAGITESKFSTVYIQCKNTPDYVCLNESCYILILFGSVVGAANFVSRSNKHLYCLNFPIVQQARFISIKCNFHQMLVQSYKTCAKFLQYFLIFYYLIGYLTREFVADLFRAGPCDGHIVSTLNIMGVISLAWTLWVSGTILLLLHDVSWHLFNIYATKMFPFRMDSVFPEDKPKILTSNLTSDQPLLVQHLAFQYLSSIASSSSIKRKQIYIISHDTGSANQPKWNLILDECLARLKKLTTSIKDHKQIALRMEQNKVKTTKSSKSSSSSQSSSGQSPAPDSSQFMSVSAFNHRPKSCDTLDGVNMSCFDVSSLNTTNAGNPLNSPNLNGSMLTVPTPKLWTKQIRKRAALHSNVSSPVPIIQPYQEVPQVPYKTLNSQIQALLQRGASAIKKFPVVSFLFNEIPSHSMANLYSEHNIYRWSIRSLSSLSAYSLNEDDYGVVQRRLHEVINCLLDLVVTLDKHGKVLPICTSETTNLMLRQQQSIKNEAKSAVYRITDTFSTQLESIPVDAEFRRKLRSFVEHQE
uniref:Nucleoporin NDC1 n=1 Tax=Ciona intestinalis TaxID=7719 RepID=F6PV21_CIOIN|nr:nucleoporin NDC1 [Ciona intestinalis]|eukprot:XP_002129457.1 nucleoporin NDC1 [Ciona intestinalis]